MTKIDGASVFITGGGGGIGGGMAQAFAERGARIVLADIDLRFAEEEAAKLPSGTEVVVVPIDVTSLESWASARQTAEARFGRIDVLCNNAGIASGFKPLTDMRPDAFARLMAVNVAGVYHGILTFAPAMTERRSGHIVNTSSMNGLNPFPGPYPQPHVGIRKRRTGLDRSGARGPYPRQHDGARLAWPSGSGCGRKERTLHHHPP
jgi:NAD(P)-dependent dehydrogenase (short-subunit alcohol dehydrogenase family)